MNTFLFVDFLHALVKAEMRNLIHFLSLAEFSGLLRFITHYQKELNVTAGSAQAHHERVYIAALFIVSRSVFHHYKFVFGCSKRFVELFNAMHFLNSFVAFYFLGTRGCCGFCNKPDLMRSFESYWQRIL